MTESEIGVRQRFNRGALVSARPLNHIALARFTLLTLNSQWKLSGCLEPS